MVIRLTGTKISRSSSFSFKGKDVAIPTIAEQLRVAHVLEGSVRRSGNRVRITAQLIEGRSDSHLWSETYDRALGDIFAIQDEIAAKVVNQLKVKLVGTTPTIVETDPEAYALFLQGQYLYTQGTAESMARAEEVYRQALTIDPGYAAAWTGLGTLFKDQANNDLRPPEEGWKLAREAAEKAIELDPNYASAHSLLGRLTLESADDLTTAARHYEKALALDPTSVNIIGSASSFLMNVNRLDEAILFYEYVVDRDPVNPSAHYNLAVNYFYAGRLKAAEESLDKTITLSPEFLGAQMLRGEILLFKGEAELALAAFKKETDEEWSVKGQALASHALGRQKEFEAAFAELKDGWGSKWPSEVAHVYAYIGELDAAFDLLDKESPGGWGEGRHIRLYDNLRGDARWQLFLEKMGVSDDQLAKIEFNLTLPK